MPDGYGIHFCLGAVLARLKAPIALQALFDRWPGARLAEQSLPGHSGVMRGLLRLPLLTLNAVSASTRALPVRNNSAFQLTTAAAGWVAVLQFYARKAADVFHHYLRRFDCPDK